MTVRASPVGQALRALQETSVWPLIQIKIQNNLCSSAGSLPPLQAILVFCCRGSWSVLELHRNGIVQNMLFWVWFLFTPHGSHSVAHVVCHSFFITACSTLSTYLPTSHLLLLIDISVVSRWGPLQKHWWSYFSVCLWWILAFSSLRGHFKEIIARL